MCMGETVISSEVERAVLRELSRAAIDALSESSLCEEVERVDRVSRRKSAKGS